MEYKANCSKEKPENHKKEKKERGVLVA